MEFFTNRIIVNGPKKSFADIINEVSNNGMKKKASKAAELSEGEKSQLTPAQEKLPENLAKAIAKSKKKKKNKKTKKGKKNAGPNCPVKISSITPNEDGTVTLDIEEKVLATKVAEEEYSSEPSGDEMDEDGDEMDGDGYEMDEDGDEMDGDGDEMDEDGDEMDEDGDEMDEDGDEMDEDEDESEDDDLNMQEEDPNSEDASYVASLESFEKEMGLGNRSAPNMKKAIEGDKCGCGTNYAESKEASSIQFVKIANLTDKQKGVFRKYWSNIWPKEFIDAVLDTEN
jgi:uncharacterized protein (DUF4415 family)